MKNFIILITTVFLTITMNYCVFAEDSFVVSLQTAKSLTYNNNSYYSTADVIESGQDFYLFFCIDNTLDLYAYQFKLNYDKRYVELINDDGTPIIDSDTANPVSFNNVYNPIPTHQNGYNGCSTLADGRGEVKYFVTLQGDMVLPAKSEIPYRLASVHFRVKQDAIEGQALFSLETDKFKKGVSLLNKDGRQFAYSANITKIINIHNVLPDVPLPPTGTYNYIDDKWQLTLTKEADPTVKIFIKTTIDPELKEYTTPILLDSTNKVEAYTRRTRGNMTADSTTVSFSTPTVYANPPSGGYDYTPDIKLYSIPSGYDIYYTTTDDTSVTAKYTNPIVFNDDNTIHTIKTILGRTDANGNVVYYGNTFKSFDYILRPNAPVADHGSTEFNLLIGVTLSSSTISSTIHYTLDGTTPTLDSPTFVGPSPIAITSDTTLKAIAIKNGISSLVSTYDYKRLPPNNDNRTGGGGGTTTVYKYVTVEKILADLKYKVVDGKAVYEVPAVEGDATGDYVITTDATQNEIEIKLNLQHVIDGAKGERNFIIKTKTDTFVLPFDNIDYPSAVKASNGIKPNNVPVTLEYIREAGDSPLIANANLIKGSKFYSFKLTAYINKVSYPIRYLEGYAQYTFDAPEIPSGKVPLAIAMNGNIIQTPLFIDSSVAGKKTVVLRTLSDHPVCLVFGDKKTYDDVIGGWYQNDIERLSTLRIVNGRPDGFEPNSYITRAELSAMVSRSLGAVMKDITTSAFTDLDKTNWSYYEANNAQKWSLINGYSDSTFRPDQEITRVETIQMIANCLSYIKKETAINTVEAGKYLANIVDANEIDGWAVPSVVMIVKYGIIKGYEDGTIQPERKITRAEAATLIARLIKNFNLVN